MVLPIIIWSFLPAVTCAATVSYTVPTTAPNGAAALDPAPVGVSSVFLLAHLHYQLTRD